MKVMNFLRRFPGRALLLLAPLLLLQVQLRGAEVNVILWFDTEDYLLPADDDAAKRLAEMLSERNIRATFKVVGEKARVLEKRGRQDVIQALKKHDIGYHANFHSVHPTPTEYLAEAGLLDGMEEFIRREGGGAADVRRIFGVPTLSCYGQPGSSWAPQAVAALRKIGVAPHGVPTYVDEGNHIGLNEKPFWYAGALNVYHMGRNYTRMDLHDPAAVEPAKKKVSEIADRLRAEGGGLISIFYHPCEWVHQEFWDGVNFRRGANPPREEWKAPPQRPARETEAAFQRFAQYIDHIRALDGVKFVTASDLALLYPNRAVQEGLKADQMVALGAAAIKTGDLNFQVLDGAAYSLADQIEMLTLAQLPNPAFPIRASGILGPDAEFTGARLTSSVPRTAWVETVRDVADFMAREHRVPARVYIGPDAISPADFLYTLARLTSVKERASSTIEIARAGEITPMRQAAADTPNLFGGWVIHKEGFRAPKVMQIARLQAWTLKPALPRQLPKAEALYIEKDFKPDGDLQKPVWNWGPTARIDHQSGDASIVGGLSTTVQVRWSKENLYVGFTAPYTELNYFEPAKLDSERIGLWERDVVEMFISPELESPQKKYFEFEVAPNGEKLDLVLDNRKANFDWNSHFQAAVKIDSTGKIWSCEWRIPWSAMVEKIPQAGDKWRVNFYRIDKANKAFLAFSPTLAPSFHTPEKFGTLEFVK